MNCHQMDYLVLKDAATRSLEDPVSVRFRLDLGQLARLLWSGPCIAPLLPFRRLFDAFQVLPSRAAAGCVGAGCGSFAFIVYEFRALEEPTESFLDADGIKFERPCVLGHHVRWKQNRLR